MIRTNFRRKKPSENKPKINDLNQKRDLTKEEFEEFVIKSGSKGSFMVYRSKKKDVIFLLGLINAGKHEL